MQVGDEDVVQTTEFNVAPTHLHLSSLTTINHIQFVTQVNDLGTRPVTGGRQGGSTSQNSKVKISHISSFNNWYCKDNTKVLLLCEKS